MQRKQIRAVALLIVLLSLCLLPGCKGKDKENEDGASEGIEAYTIGEESITALTPDEGSQVVVNTVTTYTYDGLADAGRTASTYVSQLSGAESGFSVVDEEYVITDSPDFTTPEGEVLLAKNVEAGEEEEDKKGEEEGEETPPANLLLTVRVTWSEGTCVVAVDDAEGQVTEPPPPPAGMTLVEAEDYLRSLAPEDLGLSGDTMEEYTIYTMSGAVRVDGTPCVRMNVYTNDNPQHTNELAGCYLMTGNGSKLYQLDPVTNQVTQLDVVRTGESG